MPKLSRARLAILLWSVAVILCVWRFTTPAPASDESGHFAGQHAYEVLKRVLPSSTPHPLGSEEQEQMYVRVDKELKKLGFEAHTDENWACSPLGQCGFVHNIVVEIPGKRDDAIVFSAHTDSALAGPGAGDDGHGVAILLELARHISRGTVTHENTIVLLFTDGEEEGLLGAMNFIDRDPLAARVAVAVNLEARGNAGLSMLFQTLGEDAWMIDAYAREARNPYCSSMAQAIYELMPHYTDLSALHSFGIPGVDFAFIDGESAYHSPLDTVAALSPGSLQSQGDNALAMLRALGSADLRNPPRGYASWFDVLGLFVVSMSRDAVFPLALLSWLAILGVCFVSRRKGLSQARNILKASGLALGSLVLAGGASWLACQGLEAATAEARFWQAHPWPIGIGLVLLAISIQVELARRSTLGDLELILGQLLFLSTLGLPVALVAPGSAYLFLLPVLVTAMATAFATRGQGDRASEATASIVGAAGLCSLIVWLPVIHGLRLALGISPVICVCAGFAGLCLWPLWREAGPALSRTILALALTGGGITFILGSFSEQAPKRQWLTRVVEDGAVTILRGPGPSADARLRIGGEDLTASTDPSLFDEALSIERPEVHDLHLRASHLKDKQLLSVRITSPSGAPTLVISIPEAAGLHELHIEDTGMDRGYIGGGDTRVELHNVPPQGVRIEALLKDPSLAWRIADRRPWLDAPKELRDSNARSSWDGDTTWVVFETPMYTKGGAR